VNPIFAAATEVESLCTSRDWRFCFIGALAVLRWGEPRLTRDVDVTIVTGYGQEASFVDVLLDRFEPRQDDAREFALRHRVLLLSSDGGIPIDVALGALPFERRSTDRATPWMIGAGRALRTCSAEDLVVHKVFAGRDRDWVDVEGVVARQGQDLDAGLIWEELEPLLAARDDPREATARLREILRAR
jgi:hypothetical protein